MPANTPRRGYPYPTGTDPVDVQADVERLAKAIDTDVAGFMPIGSMMMYAGDTAPTNYQLCRGQALSRTSYATLFTVIGTRYGAGDGTSTFNVPDMRGRGPIGTNTGTNPDPIVKNYFSGGPGEKYGSPAPQLLNHDHNVSIRTGGETGHYHSDQGTGRYIYDGPSANAAADISFHQVNHGTGMDTGFARRVSMSPTTNYATIDHTHLTSGVTGQQASGAQETGNYQPGLSVNFIIRAS